MFDLGADVEMVGRTALKGVTMVTLTVVMGAHRPVLLRSQTTCVGMEAAQRRILVTKEPGQTIGKLPDIADTFVI